MERSKKNIIRFIILVIAFALFVLYVYIDATPRREAELQRQKAESAIEEIKKMCADRAIEKANQPDFDGLAESNNPYLPNFKEQIPQLRESIKNKEFQECVDIWINDPIEEK